MTSWIVPSDTHAPTDTGHTTDHNHIADDLTLVNNVAPVVSGGLTGATAATRWVGGTSSGAPASGTFAVGDFVIDQSNGTVWVCVTAGSPGTWQAMINTLASQTISGVKTFTSAPVFSGCALIPAVVTLTFVASGTTLVNAASGNDFRLTLTASTTTIGNPSNSVNGQRIDFQLTQGTGGSFTVTWGGNYDFGTSGAPTLSTTAAKVDIIGFIYNSALAKWCYVGSALGF